jgi:catechol 2,3-dioxygenase-like lactoylglutathione lyase family enzyme
MKIDHVAIRVKDFERSKKFYSKYFGFEQFDSLDEPPEGKEVHLISGDVHLELLLVKDFAKEPDLGTLGKNDRGVCHFSFNVKNIENIYRKMKEDGVPITLDLTSFKLDSGRKGKCFFFKDPDDTIIDVVEWETSA